MAFYHQLLSVKIPIELDTTILDAALLNQLSNAGYENEQPCIARLYAYDNVPLLILSEQEGVSFTTQLGIGIECKKNNFSEFSEVFTILSNHIDFTGKFQVTSNFTV